MTAAMKLSLVLATAVLTAALGCAGRRPTAPTGTEQQLNPAAAAHQPADKRQAAVAAEAAGPSRAKDKAPASPIESEPTGAPPAPAVPANAPEAFSARVEVTFEPVGFAFDSAALSPAARAAVIDQAARLREIGTEAVLVVAHTDAIGPAAYNVALSTRRAEAVATVLVGAGIDTDAILLYPRGSEDPICRETTAACRRLNRRAQVYGLVDLNRKEDHAP